MDIFKTLALMLMCAMAGSYFGKLHATLELLSHFRVHFAALFVLCAAVFAYAWQVNWFALSLIAVSVNLVAIVPWYFSEQNWSESDTRDSLKVLVSNVYLGNRDYDSLSQLVGQERPDILGLIEVDSRWLENLDTIRRDYPFRFEYPQEDLLGLALYSKLPMVESTVRFFGESATPAIVATIESGEGQFEVILAHPPLPLGALNSARRNSQLQQMARYVRESEQQVLLIGDLNTTMWSPYYKDFERESGLSNARAGYGIGATFPSIPALGIPIDHILITAPSQIGDFRVQENIGSDHLPVSARIKIVSRAPRTSANATDMD